MEFEIDFGELSSATASPPPGPLLASVDGMVAQLSAEECVFQVRDSEAVHVMTLDVLKALDQMRSFAPAARHRERIARIVPGVQGRSDVIDRVVASLVRRGLVVEAAEALDAALGPAPAAPAAPAPVVVRTCERPAALEALLASLPVDEATRVLVLDDSRSEGAVTRNRAVCAAGGGNVRHLDRAWRERLLTALGAVSPAVRELLLPEDPRAFSGGATWNTASLLTAGTRPLLLDDDMRWDLRTFGDRGQTVGLAASPEPRMRFGPDRNALSRELTPPDRDWFALLPGICGQPLRHAAAAMGSALDADSLAGQDFRHFHRLLAGARVKTVRFGYYGDSCMDTRLWLYFAAPDDLRTLCPDRGQYYAQLRAPCLIHGHDRPQVGEISNFTPTALDNTELVPPTVPLGRGEDFAFAAFLRYLHPSAVTLHLPVLMGHQRPEERASENPDAFQPWVSRFFAEYALAHLEEAEAEAPELRLEQLAARLEDLAAAPGRRRATVLREFLGFMRARIIERLQATLAGAGGAPEYFQRDVRDWIEAQGRALTESRAPRLRGWPEDLDTAACAEALAADARRQAAWLRAWSGLWSAAENRLDDLLEL